MRYTPPQKIALSKQIKKSLIASALLFAFNFSSPLAAPGQSINNDYLKSDGDGDEFKTSFSSDQNFDSISLENFTPPNTYNQHAISVASKTGAVLTITGDTYIESYTDRPKSGDGTYAITAGSYQNKASGIIHLQGNIDINVEHEQGIDSKYGANAIYASYKNSTIYLGSNGTTTKIWVLDSKPDAISAKHGGQVIFNSTRNKLVGSIDMMDQETLGTANSIVDLKISEDGNYWFGDEMSLHNSSIAFSSNLPEDLFQTMLKSQLGLETDYFLGTEEINDLLSNKTIADLIKSQGINLEGEKIKINQEFNLTLSDGAQWTYFGFTKGLDKEIPIDGANIKVSVYSIPKRISSITLSDGGIINLFDEDIRNKWEEIGLSKLWPELKDIDHDYVRVGYLNGSGGIFRIDTNGEDKSKSDLIFVENTQEGKGGVHHVQVEGLDTLNSISDTNTLTFALVSKEATEGGVRFSETENVEGDRLFNYELDIRPIRIENEDDLNALKDKEEFEGLDDILQDYTEGSMYWEIYRVVRQNSSSTLGMIGSGYAGYDLAVDMDRYDRRIHESIQNNFSNNGLWIRASHGRKGASRVYENDIDTVTIGFERDIIPSSNRLGAWFSYTKGDVDYSSVRGSADLDRYELAVYDTILLNNQYIDLVGRIGRVSNEFSVTSASGAYKTSGDFDQDYVALSAEYGYTLKDKNGVFIEPQLQIQATYLKDFDYSVERGMKAKADSETSFIGRVGLRFGREISSGNSSGEFYFRGDVQHQFTDGQSAHLTAGNERVDTVWGDKDTWATFGVGGYLNWKDNMSFQVDVERTAGGETIDTWLVSGRVNYLF